METTHSFGYWIRRRRLALDLTQKELAFRVSCSLATIKKIEADQRRPSTKLAELLAEALAVPAEDTTTFIAAARGTEPVDQLLLPQKPARLKQSGLPRNKTPFIGRSADLEAISLALKNPKHRLITITGPGGIGKTRCAIEAVRQQRQQFSDGIWFIPLLGITDWQFLPEAIANGLGLPFAGPLSPTEQLKALLSDQDALLLLDNFEQILPDGALLLDELLQRCPKIVLVVTSRERLNLRSEVAFPLTGMQPADGIALFFMLATTANRSLTISPDTELAAKKIWRLVDGMPLALEMAAAWARLLTPSEIEIELERSLDLLAATHQDFPSRHRNMEAVFEASWTRLTPTEQTVLKRLSVFRGGFTRDAMTAVTNINLPTLLGLVDKSLVERHGERYGLHELIRQFAAQKLADEPELEQAVLDQHSKHYIDLLKRVKNFITRGGRSDLEWLHLVNSDIDNIRAAWNWTIRQGYAHKLIPAVQALYQYYDIQGRIWEGCSLLQHALTSIDQIVDDVSEEQKLHIQALLLDKLGALFDRLGRFSEADLFLTKSLSLYDQIDLPEEKAGAFISSGAHALMTNQHRQSSRFTQEALDLFSKTGNLWGIAVAMNFLGIIFQLSDRPDRSKRQLEEAIAYWERLGSHYGRARAQVHLGSAYYLLDDYEGARRQLEEALQTIEQVNDVTFLPLALNHLGATWLALADLETAWSQYERSYRHSIRYRMLPFAMSAIVGLGLVSARTGNEYRAAILLIFALRHAKVRSTLTLVQPDATLKELEAKLAPEILTQARQYSRELELEKIDTVFSL